MAFTPEQTSGVQELLLLCKKQELDAKNCFQKHSFCANRQKTSVEANEVVELLQKLVDSGMDVINTENLNYMNGERAYSLAKGQ